MNWQQAIEIVREYHHPEFETAVEYLAHEVSEDGYVPQALHDWIAEGSWSGNETPEQIKSEWKEHIELSVERFVLQKHLRTYGDRYIITE